LRLDPTVNRAYLQGLRSSTEIPFAERSVFANVLSDHWVFFQGAFALHEEGQLDRETYEGFLTWFACQVATPGGRAFWSEVSAVGLPSAAAAVNERIERGKLPDILQFSFNRMDPES
jgi:hypothetical protein